MGCEPGKTARAADIPAIEKFAGEQPASSNYWGIYDEVKIAHMLLKMVLALEAVSSLVSTMCQLDLTDRKGR